MIEKVINMEISQNVIALINPIILAFLLLVAFLGYKSGLLIQVFSLLNVIVKIILAWIFAPIFGAALPLYNPDLGVLNESALDILLTDRLNSVIWFVLIYLVLTLLFMFLKPLVKGIGKLPIIKTLNQILGFVFGLAKGLVFLLIFIYLLSTPFFVNGREAVEESYLSIIEENAPLVFDSLSDWANSSPALARLLSNDVLDDEDRKSIEEWLTKQEVDQETIDEILERLPNNDE